MRKQRSLFRSVLVAAGLLVAAALCEDVFTIAVIPDSQQEILTEGDTRLANRVNTKAGSIRTWVRCPSIAQEKDDGSAFTVTGVTWVAAASGKIPTTSKP